MCAQSITGTNLAANAAATLATPCYELRIAWGRSSWPTNWASQSADETGRLLDWNWSRNLAIDPAQLSSAKPADLSLTLDNSDQRFSPFNTSSPIAADILGSTTTAGGTSVSYPKLFGSPVRLREGYTDATNGDEFITVFSGYIDSPVGDNWGLSGDRLTIKCLDRGVELVEHRRNSFMETNRRVDEYIGIVLTFANIASNLDRGNFVIPYAWMDNESIWSECQDAAAADGGWFYINELGVPRFRNATWWLDATASTVVQATITPAIFQDLGATIDWSQMATGIKFDWTPRIFGGNQDLYRSQDVIEVPPGNTSVPMRYSYPAADIAFFVSATPPDIIVITSGGRRLDNVVWSFGGSGAQEATMLFENNGTETGYVAPFTISGPAIMGPQSKPVEYNVTSLAPYRTIKRISPSPYIQTEAQAEMLKVLYADRLRYPRLTYVVRGYKAMPWLQLGDLVRINVPEPYTGTRDMIITGISSAGSADAPFMQTLTGIDRAGLFEYDDYFVIGTSAYGVPATADIGRMWL